MTSHSLRDIFAGLAMHAHILASRTSPDAMAATIKASSRNGKTASQMICRDSYAIADEMLSERENGMQSTEPTIRETIGDAVTQLQIDTLKNELEKARAYSRKQGRELGEKDAEIYRLIKHIEKKGEALRGTCDYIEGRIRCEHDCKCSACILISTAKAALSPAEDHSPDTGKAESNSQGILDSSDSPTISEACNLPPGSFKRHLDEQRAAGGPEAHVMQDGCDLQSGYRILSPEEYAIPGEDEGFQSGKWWVIDAAIQAASVEFPIRRKVHNPDNLTPDQVGVSEGWRLLDEDEIVEDAPKLKSIETCFPVRWDSSGWMGASSGSTYRTKLSREQLRKARGLEGKEAH